MSLVLEIVTWAVIVGATLAAALTALTLARGRPGLREAKPGHRREWTLLFLFLRMVPPPAAR